MKGKITAPLFLSTFIGMRQKQRCLCHANENGLGRFSFCSLRRLMAYAISSLIDKSPLPEEEEEFPKGHRSFYYPHLITSLAFITYLEKTTESHPGRDPFFSCQGNASCLDN
jgi:hypothetical protein